MRDVKCSIFQNGEMGIPQPVGTYPYESVWRSLEELQQEKARGGSSKHEKRVGNVATGSAVDGGLVRELNSGCEGSCVGGVNVRGNIRGGFHGVIAGDVDRLDEGVEVASGNVVGVVPVDHASSPLNSTLRSSIDTSGPHTGVGAWILVSSQAMELGGSCT